MNETEMLELRTPPCACWDLCPEPQKWVGLSVCPQGCCRPVGTWTWTQTAAGQGVLGEKGSKQGTPCPHPSPRPTLQYSPLHTHTPSWCLCLLFPARPSPGPSLGQEVGWPIAGQKQAQKLGCKLHSGSACPELGILVREGALRQEQSPRLPGALSEPRLLFSSLNKPY